jgi:hypothetical protein
VKRLTLIILLVCANWAHAGLFRVHYSSIRGTGKDITIHANSPAEASRTVMDMFPGTVVTGVFRIKKTLK